ncbi:hypothetical protein SAMN05661086_03637 [Anaeromicropila populeti]|uniref:Uncharacterized protein n=2 Tax=Anaeromicropila populeti TaxID=37658 RepID=A0A1I6LX09_9FIRM|nr:hypothetical protein SAMN05661086_03637 [Anaeromicropila populeti]
MQKKIYVKEKLYRIHEVIVSFEDDEELYFDDAINELDDNVCFDKYLENLKRVENVNVISSKNGNIELEDEIDRVSIEGVDE